MSLTENTQSNFTLHPVKIKVKDLKTSIEEMQSKKTRHDSGSSQEEEQLEGGSPQRGKKDNVNSAQQAQMTVGAKKLSFDKTTIEKATRLREKARRLYQKGEFFEALSKCHAALEEFDLGPLTQELSHFLEKKQASVLKIVKDCYLLSANCYISIDQYVEAMNLLDELLIVENHNVEALEIRTRCWRQMNQYNSALLDIQKALTVQPENTRLQELQNKLLREYENKDKRRMSNGHSFIQKSPLFIKGREGSFQSDSGSDNSPSKKTSPKTLLQKVMTYVRYVQKKWAANASTLLKIFLIFIFLILYRYRKASSVSTSLVQ